MVLGKASGQRRVQASSSSRRVGHPSTARLSSGRLIRRHENLTSQGIRTRKKRDAMEAEIRFDGMPIFIVSSYVNHVLPVAMNVTERQALQAMQAIPNEGDDSEWEPLTNENMMEGILAGDEVIDISHEGGEFAAVFDGLEDELLGSHSRLRAKDLRTRRDRTERRTAAFNAQLEALVDVYMDWSATTGINGLQEEYTVPTKAVVQGTYLITIVDTFSESKWSLVFLKANYN
jgi:hypothetical protein